MKKSQLTEQQKKQLTVARKNRKLNREAKRSWAA